MKTVVLIALGLSLLSVLGVLVLGLYAMAKGGEFNKKNSNKLMRWRVGLQGLALLLLALSYFLSQT